MYSLQLQRAAAIATYDPDQARQLLEDGHAARRSYADSAGIICTAAASAKQCGSRAASRVLCVAVSPEGGCFAAGAAARRGARLGDRAKSPHASGRPTAQR